MNKYIDNIINLNWKNVNSYDLAFISLVTAQEFSNSLRLWMIDMQLEDDKIFKLMYYWELMTNNLRFDDYKSTWDHYSFLFYFFVKNNLFNKVSSNVVKASFDYINFVNWLSSKEKIITIFDREVNLPNVFQQIVDSVKFWDDLKFYHYYLTNHIMLDSQENWHWDIVKKYYKEDENKELLEKYWEQRYMLYKSLI